MAILLRIESPREFRGVRRQTATLAFVLLVSAIGCTGDEDVDEGRGALTPTTVVDGGVDAAAAGPPRMMQPTEPTVAVAFRRPLTLPEVRALAERREAVLVALWRVDGVCVRGVSGGGGPPSQDLRRSSFAYADHDAMRARQVDTTPVTDGGWTFALRERFHQEWHAAKADGVRFIGAALLLDTVTDRVEGAEIERVTPVPSRRTDSDVLFLRGHETALAPHFPPPDPSPC